MAVQMGLLRTLFPAFCYSFEKSKSFVGQFPLLNFLDWRVKICWILLVGLINIPRYNFLGLFWIISNLSGKTLKSVKYSGRLHFMCSGTWDSRALIRITLTKGGGIILGDGASCITWGMLKWSSWDRKLNNLYGMYS